MLLRCGKYSFRIEVAANICQCLRISCGYVTRLKVEAYLNAICLEGIVDTAAAVTSRYIYILIFRY